MKRGLISALIEWKTKSGRKPLILEGTRQVGKTYLLKDFGQKHFPQFHYLNFEKDADLEKLFNPNLDPKRIITELSFHLKISIDIERDLIIFDEIQACPKALTSLKYFQEELPQLALCAAGSLLGIHLNAGSFPVGKVDLLNLYPLNFEEFLQGIGDERALAVLQNINVNTEFSDIVHDHLWQQLKLYFVIGGLPEVITTYIQYQENLFQALEKVRLKQDILINNYYADIAKHSGKINAMHIDRLWRSIPQQLARTKDGSIEKFKFKDIIPGIERYNRLANVIDWLEGAGLIIKSHIAYSAQLPLTGYTKENSFKLMMFDVGILGAMSDLPPKTILDYDYGTYKGYFAENFVAEEFLANNVKNLYSWQEKNSELEFLRVIDGNILPIEIKSGNVTHAKSLKAFAEKYHPKYTTIMSANKLYIDKKLHNHCYPLYLAGRFPLKGLE